MCGWVDNYKQNQKSTFLLDMVQATEPMVDADSMTINSTIEFLKVNGQAEHAENLIFHFEAIHRECKMWEDKC